MVSHFGTPFLFLVEATAEFSFPPLSFPRVFLAGATGYFPGDRRGATGSLNDMGREDTLKLHLGQIATLWPPILSLNTTVQTLLNL